MKRWHDLALAFGIPVGELRGRLSIAEFHDWDAYVELYGPLDLRQRLDHAAALVSFTVARVNGSRSQYRQFLQYPPPSPIDDSGMNDVDRQFLSALEQEGQNITSRKPH